jgi:hypothetical protein
MINRKATLSVPKAFAREGDAFALTGQPMLLVAVGLE